MTSARSVVLTPSTIILTDLIEHDSGPNLDLTASNLWPFTEAVLDAQAELTAAIRAHDQFERVWLTSRTSSPAIEGKAQDLSPPPELLAAEQVETEAAQALSEATQQLLDRPCRDRGALWLKLALIIAAGQPGPTDATTFPWAQLRALLIEIAAGPDERSTLQL